MKMLRTRYEIASLLGYKSWADYNAADKMIGSGARIAQFIQDLDTAVRPHRGAGISDAARGEAQDRPAGDAPSALRREATTKSWCAARATISTRNRCARISRTSGSSRGYSTPPATLFHVNFGAKKACRRGIRSVETW